MIEKLRGKGVAVYIRVGNANQVGKEVKKNEQ